MNQTLIKKILALASINMKKLILVLVIIFSYTLSAEAQKTSKTSRVKFEVDGVCVMCKERIEKAAALSKGVKFAVWDVDTKELYCIYNNKKTSTLKIKEALAAVGHDSNEVKATDEVYSKLDTCCLYRDDELKKH